MDNLHLVYHSVLSTPEKKKRTANCFLLFRKEMMNYRPSNITMIQYSKLVSEMWQNLSEDEKIDWKKKYEINRDCSSKEMSNEEIIDSIFDFLLLQPSSTNSDGKKLLIMNKVESYINQFNEKTPEFLLKIYYEIYLYINNNSKSFEDFIMYFFFN